MLNSPLLSQERTPIPGRLLDAAVLLCGIVPVLLVTKGGMDVGIITIVTTFCAEMLMFVGWRVSPSYPGNANSGPKWIAFGIAAALVATIGLALAEELNIVTVLCVLLPMVLLVAHSRITSEQRTLKHIMVPLLFGSVFFFAAGALGVPSIGGFPAVIGILFVAVLRATLDIEEDVLENHADSDKLAVEHHYRHRLAITAVIFFLFGTVSLWPWLGEMYGKGYFWIMLFGVLLPLAFFWGRIRQPKLEGARTALIRFNRIAPILGLFHIVAVLSS